MQSPRFRAAPQAAVRCVCVPLQTLHEAPAMNNTTEVAAQPPQFQSVKVLLSMLPCFFFLYVNCVMVFALVRKPLLLESSRYILFAHLLLSDSLQLVMTILLYILAVSMVRMLSSVCVVVTLFLAIVVKISPLNLAVMSLERYVAICFPLRHTEIATTRKVGVAVAVIWTAASIDSITQLSLFISLEGRSSTVLKFCHVNSVLRLQIYSTLLKWFSVVYFTSVGVIIVYTYFAIMIAVKTASSNVRDASKALKTVMLHMLQLCLCLTSTLFNIMNSNRMWDVNPTLANNIQYVLFVGLIVFPKCLSPLIYGLRDQTFKHIFKYYFTFGLKATVKPFPGPSSNIKVLFDE